MPEAELAWRGTLAALVIALPSVAVAAVLRGRPGALGAGLAALLVLGLFGVSGLILVCVGRRAPAKLPALSLVGALARMVAYGALLAALTDVGGIDRTSTVVTTCLLLAATLVYEVRFAATAPGFYWLGTSAPDAARGNERTTG